MRYQGKITDWKDDKGFGFVTPNVGGKKVFVHIKSFANRQRRPIGNELITYELNVDSKGRSNAGNVAFVGEKLPKVSKPSRINSPTFAILFLTFVTGAVLLGKLPLAIFWIYLLGSCATFVGYFLDKSAALKNQWRTPEITLHIFSLLGGWPGALIAQRTLRHKSKKQSFQTIFWMTVVINCAGLGWLFSSAGSRTLRTILGVL